jgi:hypothetical protein
VDVSVPSITISVELVGSHSGMEVLLPHPPTEVVVVVVTVVVVEVITGS